MPPPSSAASASRTQSATSRGEFTIPSKNASNYLADFNSPSFVSTVELPCFLSMLRMKLYFVMGFEKDLSELPEDVAISGAISVIRKLKRTLKDYE